TVENGTVTGVTVKKVAYQGNDKWAENGKDITSSVDVGLNGKTVTVSGFDYSAEENVVTDGTNGTNASGYKLVVTFNVKPDISCENWTDSKEYVTNDDKAALAKVGEKPFATVASPKAPVDTYQVTYEFDETAPDSATHPEDKRYYISGQKATVQPPEKSSVGEGSNTYTFNGWKNGEDDVEVGGKIDITRDVTLIGTWSKPSNTADYTVNYRWNNEPIPGTKPTTGSKNCGETVTVSPAQIEGYTPVSSAEKTIKIDADNSKNVIIFYYYKNVTLTANSDTKTYDGKEHSVDGFTATDAFNKPVTARFGNTWPSVKGTDAGKYPVTFAEDTENKVSDNHLYIVTKTVDGKLTITPRKVTLTSETASKVYDGTPLTKPEVTVTGDGFVEGEVTDIKAIGSVTYVSEGEVTNTIEYTTTDKFKADNYNITKHEGTLTITEASAPTPVTFDFNDVVYGDGKVTPAITKTVKGNVGKNFTEAFYVTVKGADEKSAATMSAASYTGEAEVTYSDLKNIAFQFAENDKLTFRDGDNYTYTVREKIPGKTSRMSYDTTEYTLTIKVVLDEDSNTYQVKSWQFTPGNRECPDALNIVNTYRTYHPSTPSKPTLNTGDHYAYVMGYPDGTVRPNGSITRAEVSAILFRLLSDKTRDEYFTTESSFTDVKAGAWYNNSIATLEKAGVIVDTAKGGAFRPNEAITRAELAAMLAQFSDAKPVKGVKFSDVSAEHWAYEAIAIAAKMGWIEGYPDGTFRPDATITRAEMMTLVNRALERVPSDEDHLLSKRVMLTFPDCKSGDWFYIAVQEATNSHTYERAATEKNGDEQWTALRANRDWTLLEK
ncbi:MAG: S-layer homology domain-containing protein, partial [Oscillospiraceae bacterium]|nr:S-layer homology domain-containing protein [Oscillospiraceae bacterium]